VKLQLTGSRHFGSAKPCSDIDVFTQHSPELKARLLSLGFRDLGHGGDCGPNLASMMRKRLPNGSHIDLGLYHNAERKMKEHRIASFTPIAVVMRHANKDLRRKLWGFLQRLEL